MIRKLEVGFLPSCTPICVSVGVLALKEENGWKTGFLVSEQFPRIDSFGGICLCHVHFVYGSEQRGPLGGATKFWGVRVTVSSDVRGVLRVPGLQGAVRQLSITGEAPASPEPVLCVSR